MVEPRYRVISFNGVDLERRLNELDAKGFRIETSNPQWIIMRKCDPAEDLVATPIRETQQIPLDTLVAALQQLNVAPQTESTSL